MVFEAQWAFLRRDGAALRGKRVVLCAPGVHPFSGRERGLQTLMFSGDGSRLRTARLRLGYTQQMLADFIQVSISTIERAERGGRLRTDTIALICQFFSEHSGRRVEPGELGLVCRFADGRQAGRLLNS